MKRRIFSLLLVLALITSMTAFTVQAEGETLTEAEKGAAIAKAANEMTFPTNMADFVADCPACGAKQVTWKAITTNGRVGYNVTGHFYCTGITANPHTQFIGLDNGGTVCLHLNGETLSNAGRIAVLGGSSKVNIMGTGTIIGKGTTTGDYKQGTLVAQNAGTINLYGGTYKSELADMPVVSVSSTANPKVNLYPDAVIDSSAGHNVDVVTGTFNMYGGKIQNAVTTGSGGNVRLRSSIAAFNLYEGKISGGSSSAANAGGNVYITGGAVFCQYGGEIVDGVSTTNGPGRDVFVYKGTYTLGGTANSGGIYIAENGKLNVLNDWTGKASVLWAAPVAAGQTVPEANGQCGTVTDGVFLPGGSFAGTLTCELEGNLPVTGAEGALKIEAAQGN